MGLADFATAVWNWVVRLFMQPPPPEEVPASSRPSLAADRVPRPGATPSHNRFGGRAWRYDAVGVHADGRLWRTAGEPLTCRAALVLHGDIILAAARKHGVNPALILMTIAAETGALRNLRFTGPRSFRWEAHVLNRDMSSPFKGTYSAGPMQILATTARDLIARYGAAYELRYQPLNIAPAYPTRPSPAPAIHPLYDPATNIDLGVAVIRRQLPLTGDDPILVAAAYNSGGLYESRANAWRLRSHADHLDRAARWYGDACAVLRDAGLL